MCAAEPSRDHRTVTRAKRTAIRTRGSPSPRPSPSRGEGRFTTVAHGARAPHAVSRPYRFAHAGLALVHFATAVVLARQGDAGGALCAMAAAAFYAMLCEPRGAC